MRHDLQHAIDVTKRTDATANHKGCAIISPILVTGGAGGTGRLGSHVVRRRWAEGACDGRTALGYLPARGKHLANGRAGEPDWAVGLRAWRTSWPRRATDPARQSGRQEMAADSHDTFVHRSHSSVATCHSCDKQKIPTGASTHRHTPEFRRWACLFACRRLGEFKCLPLTSSSPSWPPPG